MWSVSHQDDLFDDFKMVLKAGQSMDQVETKGCVWGQVLWWEVGIEDQLCGLLDVFWQYVLPNDWQQVEASVLNLSCIQLHLTSFVVLRQQNYDSRTLLYYFKLILQNYSPEVAQG